MLVHLYFAEIRFRGQGYSHVRKKRSYSGFCNVDGGLSSFSMNDQSFSLTSRPNHDELVELFAKRRHLFVFGLILFAVLL